jgi:hypothetical protein
MTTRCSSLLDPSRAFSSLLNPSERHSGLQSPIDLNPSERHSGLQSPIDLRCSRSPSRSAPPSRTESSSAFSRRVKRSARATRSDCLPHQADRLPHQAECLPHQAECLPHQSDCLPHQVWRTGCHMISRHLEAIDHIWFEIRDKHWGSGSSFKKGHRARISGEIDVDASVLLQADEGSIPQGSEGAAEAEVERALPRTRRAPAHAHDGALPCMHTLTTAPCPPHRPRRPSWRASSERETLGRASTSLWCKGACGERLMSPDCD